MNTFHTALSLTDAALIAGSLLVYVLLDGPDLGIGILSPLVARRADTVTLFESVPSSWTTNELWLLMHGLLLLTAFPLAFATLLPPILLPLIFMLIGLMLRGVTRWLQPRVGIFQRPLQWTFALCSITVAFSQGWIVGYIAQGLPHSGSEGALVTLGRLMFPAACGAGLIALYALLGCCWLIAKIRGPLQIFGREVGFSALIATDCLLSLIGIWVLYSRSQVAPAGLTSGHLLALSGLSAAALWSSWQLKNSLWRDQSSRPLKWAILLFITTCAAIATGIFPFILPYRYTLWAAANDVADLRNAVIGMLMVLPLILLTRWLVHRRAQRGSSKPSLLVVTTSPHMGARRTSGKHVDLHLS